MEHKAAPSIPSVGVLSNIVGTNMQTIILQTIRNN